MLRTTDIENRLKESEQGIFQKVCNEILCSNGFKPYSYPGSVKGSNKTKKGTPDSVFLDKEGRYVYVEITTQTNRLSQKIYDDVRKCLDKIEKYSILNGKISKIIFFHNRENLDESICEKINSICGDINFEMYGLEYISSELQQKCPGIAMTLLGVRDDVQVINSISDESLLSLVTTLKKKDLYNTETIDQIKEKINISYKKAADIINCEEATINITGKQREELQDIFNVLSAFDFYYKDKNDENSKDYYHNLLVILAGYDNLKAISYYSNLPDFVKEDNRTRLFYAITLLQFEERYDIAKEILEDLYLNKGYVPSLEVLVKLYFYMKDYENVVKILSKVKKRCFDRFGVLASIYIMSKNSLKKYSESEIKKLNNSKFSKMPLFYSCTSLLLYQLNKRKKAYIEQFQKGINILNNNDLLAIEVMSKCSIDMELQDLMIAYFEENANIPEILTSVLVKMILSKKKISSTDIIILEKIDMEILEDDVDKDLILARIYESKGRELEAIKSYKTSFQNRMTLYSAFKYVRLSIKNKSKLDDIIMGKILMNSSVDTYTLCADAYRHFGELEKSLDLSFKAVYLAPKTLKYKDVFRQFWGIDMFRGDKKRDTFNHVVTDSIVILSSVENKKTLTYFIVDDEFFVENSNLFTSIIVRSSSEVGSDLLGLTIGEKLFFDGVEYEIKEISDRYTYCNRNCFKYVEENKHLRFIRGSTDDEENVVEQIKQIMIEKAKSSNQLLDNYQNSSKMPLSALISNDYNFDDYAKLINTLISNTNRVLFAGEVHDLNLCNGFVVDVTTLIVLSLFEIIDLIPQDFYKKIYITQSLKNKIQFYYDSLIRKQDEMESFIGVVNDNNLTMTEIKVIDQIKSWRKLMSFLNKITIVEYECEKDFLFTEKSESIIDKVQFDLMSLSVSLNLPFVCDDLIIRRLSNIYKVQHTNSIQIVRSFVDNYEQYMKFLIILAKANYIYVLHDDVFLDICSYLFLHYTEDNKLTFLNLLNALCENEVSFKYNLPILHNIKIRVEKIKYLKIFDEEFENDLAVFVFNELESIIKKKCDEYDIDFK